jgi:hypothetical protein
MTFNKTSKQQDPYIIWHWMTKFNIIYLKSSVHRCQDSKCRMNDDHIWYQIIEKFKQKRKEQDTNH